MPTEVFGKQIDPASVGAEPAAPQPSEESLRQADDRLRRIAQKAAAEAAASWRPAEQPATQEEAAAAEKVREGIKTDLKAKKPMPPPPKHTGPDEQKPPQRGIRV